MSKTLTWCSVIEIVLCGVFVLSGSARSVSAADSFVNRFPDSFFRGLYDDRGTIEAEAREEEGNLVMVIRRRGDEQPRSGWGGACIFSRELVDLSDATTMALSINSSAQAAMEVKIEKMDHQLGTIWVDHLKRLEKGLNQLKFLLKNAEDTSRTKDTLKQVKKVCLLVPAEGFPKGMKEVTIRVSPVRFQ